MDTFLGWCFTLGDLSFEVNLPAYLAGFVGRVLALVRRADFRDDYPEILRSA